MAGRAGRIIALFVSILSGWSAAHGATIQSFAGRFDRSARLGIWNGHGFDNFKGNDVAEIVPLDSKAAYFRIHLDFTNAHECNIWGVASFAYGTLTYRDPEPPLLPNSPPCVLTISHKGRKLVIDDGDYSCHDLHCGQRGTLSQVALPWKSRRPVTYLRKLKASPEYQNSLIEWRTGKPMS